MDYFPNRSVKQDTALPMNVNGEVEADAGSDLSRRNMTPAKHLMITMVNTSPCFVAPMRSHILSHISDYRRC